MKRFLLYCLPIFILMILHGCKKEDDPSDSSYLFKVTLDKNERVVKVVEYDINDPDTTGILMTMEYYNDSIIQNIYFRWDETFPSNSYIYYLNGIGLVDSINYFLTVLNTYDKYILEYNDDKLSKLNHYEYNWDEEELNLKACCFSKLKYNYNILDSIYVYSYPDSLVSGRKVLFTNLPNKLKISFLGLVPNILSGFYLNFSCSAFGSQEDYLVSELRFSNSHYYKFNYKPNNDGYLDEMTIQYIDEDKTIKSVFRFEYTRLNN